MVQRKEGHIVLVSSVAGKVPIPFRSSFAASKHALQAFSDALRAEMAIHNIKVLVSCPEYIPSDAQLTENDETAAPEEQKDEKKGIHQGLSISNCFGFFLIPLKTVNFYSRSRTH